MPKASKRNRDPVLLNLARSQAATRERDQVLLDHILSHQGCCDLSNLGTAWKKICHGRGGLLNYVQSKPAIFKVSCSRGCIMVSPAADQSRAQHGTLASAAGSLAQPIAAPVAPGISAACSQMPIGAAHANGARAVNPQVSSGCSGPFPYLVPWVHAAAHAHAMHAARACLAQQSQVAAKNQAPVPSAADDNDLHQTSEAAAFHRGYALGLQASAQAHARVWSASSLRQAGVGMPFLSTPVNSVARGPSAQFERTALLANSGFSVPSTSVTSMPSLRPPFPGPAYERPLQTSIANGADWKSSPQAGCVSSVDQKRVINGAFSKLVEAKGGCCSLLDLLSCPEWQVMRLNPSDLVAYLSAEPRFCVDVSGHVSLVGEAHAAFLPQTQPSATGTEIGIRKVAARLHTFGDDSDCVCDDLESVGWQEHFEALQRNTEHQEGWCDDELECQAWLAHATALDSGGGSGSPHGQQSSNKTGQGSPRREEKPQGAVEEDAEAEANGGESEEGDEEEEEEEEEEEDVLGEAQVTDESTGEGGWEEATWWREGGQEHDEEIDDAEHSGFVCDAVDEDVFVGLTESPLLGQSVIVCPSALRWTHDCIQRLFTCGRRLNDVATSLAAGKLSWEELPQIEVVHYKGKWFSRNNRRLWCLKEAKIPSVRAKVSRVDQHFLRGLSTRTDGLEVAFYPPVLCRYCNRELVNRKALRVHYCEAAYGHSALAWDHEASEASSDAGSEDGCFDEDGAWFSRLALSKFLRSSDDGWAYDSWGRSALWRAAAAGNTTLLRLLIANKRAIDETDCEGVTPMLAAVRRGQWCTAEVLMRAGAFQMPWTWTVRKGKRWSQQKYKTFEKLVRAVKKRQPFATPQMRVRTPAEVQKAQQNKNRAKKKKAETQAKKAAIKAAGGRKKSSC